MLGWHWYGYSTRFTINNITRFLTFFFYNTKDLRICVRLSQLSEFLRVIYCTLHGQSHHLHKHNHRTTTTTIISVIHFQLLNLLTIMTLVPLERLEGGATEMSITFLVLKLNNLSLSSRSTLNESNFCNYNANNVLTKHTTVTQGKEASASHNPQSVGELLS